MLKGHTTVCVKANWTEIKKEKRAAFGGQRKIIQHCNEMCLNFSKRKKNLVRSDQSQSTLLLLLFYWKPWTP